MARRRLGALFQSPPDRFADRIAAAVAELGWTASTVDGWSAVYTGRDDVGREFTVRAIFGGVDGPSDVLEWRSGPLRLDELVLAVANVRGTGRSWLRSLEVAEGLSHDDPDPAALRDALNRKAAEGASPAELNDYALQLGAGGTSGVVMRFERTAVEVEPAIAGMHVLSESPDVAARVLTNDARERLEAIASQASSAVATPTFVVFAGRPFSKVSIDIPGTTIELLRELAELGAVVRAQVDLRL